MADEKSPTPEKQLLRLIEGGAEAKTVSQAKKKRKVLSFFSLGALKGRLAFLKSYFSRENKEEPFWKDITAINKVLTVGVAFVFLGAGGRLLVSMKSIKQAHLKTTSVMSQEQRDTRTVPSAESVAFYLEKVRSRNIFSMVQERQIIAPITPSATTSEMQDIYNRFKLVGISWSEDPDVMIEDTKAGKTFFLKREQSIGDVILRAVFPDKVILEYKGQEIELK